MIGDGLSHVGFGALAVAMAFHWAPLPVAIPVVVVAAFLLLRLSENSKIKGDSAIALIASSSLAIGVTVISLASGQNADVYSYMFGSILAMSKSDVYLSILLSAFVLILFILFYPRIFAVTFDENFAKNNLVDCVTELKSGDNVHAFRDAGDALGTLILKYSSKEEMFNVIENMDQFVHIIID